VTEHARAGGSDGLERLWAIGKRLRDEAIHGWSGRVGVAAFNVGYAPASAAIREDPRTRAEALQIQLYEEVAAAALEARPCGPGARLVEIAAGSGAGLSYLARRAAWSVCGVDRSSVAARRARGQGLDVRRADVAGLPFAGESFDYAICIELVGVGEAKKAAAMAEVGRVLKADGAFVYANFELGSLAQARRQLERQAAFGGLAVRTMRDATENALRALDEDESRKAALYARAPRLMRGAVRESLALKGTERRRQWRAGERCYFIATLARSR
jgi:SAM-dependent methyltransferase